MIWDGHPIMEQPVLAVTNMWVPALAALVARLLLREGFGDVSFRLRLRGMGREWLIAWLFPLAVGLLAYGVAWGSGLEQFRPSTLASLGLSELPAPLRVVLAYLVVMTLFLPVNALTATGEELGWRGYLLTRLIDARCPRPVLVSGLIWSAWHAPLIVGGIYAAGPIPSVAVLLFAISMTSQSYVYARVRLATGSVWSAVILHASWNGLILGPFTANTVGASVSRGESIWIGEAGVLVATAAVVVTLLLTRRPVPLRRSPVDETGATVILRRV